MCCTSTNKRRDRIKQHEVNNSKEQSFIASYLRRIEAGNNEVLKIILEDSKKNKKSKWWETTRKYTNWAQIEEQEIKEKTAKEIRGRIAKVVEEVEKRIGEELLGNI